MILWCYRSNRKQKALVSVRYNSENRFALGCEFCFLLNRSPAAAPCHCDGSGLFACSRALHAPVYHPSLPQKCT